MIKNIDDKLKALGNKKTPILKKLIPFKLLSDFTKSFFNFIIELKLSFTKFLRGYMNFITY